MKMSLRAVRGMCRLALAGFLLALTVSVSWGQPEPPEMPPDGVPPTNDTAMVESSTLAPPSPFSPPFPTPLPRQQAVPFVPAVPFPGEEPPVPLVRLRVRAPARLEPGKEIEYRLLVTNVSNANAYHVLLRDRLPLGTEKSFHARPEPTRKTEAKDKSTDLLWELGTLKPGEHKEIVLTLKPEGNKDVENRAYVQFEHGQKVITRVARPGVRAKITAPAQAVQDESIPVHIEVANTGAVPLRNVVVTDELPAGLVLLAGKPEPSQEKPLTWKLGDIPPHQTRRVECQMAFLQPGTFRNTVKVKADGGASTSDSAAVVVGQAKLGISTSGPQRRLVNRPIPYHIAVRNSGTMPVTNVEVSDELPRGIDFVSASPGGRKEGGFVRWSLGTLPPGERRSLLLVLKAPAAGWCWNQVTVKADKNLSDKARFGPTYIESAHTAVLEIDRSAGSFEVGQKASYTIRLFNPAKEAVIGASVLVNVPDELSITGMRGATQGQREGQLVRFDPVEVLDGGREAVHVIEVEAKKAGEAALRTWWTDGVKKPGPPETWEDKIIIVDPARASDGPAPANLQAREKEVPKAHDFSLKTGR